MLLMAPKKQKKSVDKYPRKNLTLSPDAQDWLEEVSAEHDSQSEVIRAGLWLLKMFGATARHRAVNAARSARPFGATDDSMQVFAAAEVLRAAQTQLETARKGKRSDLHRKENGNAG